MPLVPELIHNVLEVGYLSLEAEHHLKTLFTTDRFADEQAALQMLQHALIAGQIEREADPTNYVSGSKIAPYRTSRSDTA